MTELSILHFPDPRLRKKAKEVTEVTPEILAVMDNMLETMYQAPGIGLAATQVNIHKRLIVIDVSEEKNQPLRLINPKIIEKEGQIVHEEGCLSVPGVYEKVKRAEHIKYSAMNKQVEVYTAEAEDLLAVCIQHEIDHLDGKLFVDYLSKIKQQRIRTKLIKEEHKK